MSEVTYDRCQALTDDGERCSRPARDGKFCYQHDEDDPTVDDEAGEDAEDGGSADVERTADGGSADAELEDGESADPDRAEAEPEDESSAGAGDGAEEPDSEIVAIRRTVQSMGSDVIGRELDGVVGLSRNDDGWQVTVEVVERSAVPDTQDILGQYEVDLGGDREVTGYRRIDRYRRGDTQRDDYVS